MDAPNAPQPPRWRAAFLARLKRRMKWRIAVLCVWVGLLQVPQVADWRRDLTGQVGPTLDQLAVDLRKLTLIARAEREAREGGGRRIATTAHRADPAACAVPRVEARGQGGSILFKRPGGC